MTVAYPWSGRDFTGAVPLSGRAAIGVPSGAGFNWRSVARHSSGWVVPRGLRGLGQDSTGDPLPSGVDSLPAGSSAPTSTAPWISPNIYGTGGGTSTTTQAPWYAPLIAAGLATGQSIANWQLNPLLQKQTYMTTPQGGVYASNVAGAVPGLTTTNIGSMLPILLIGGLGLMLVMGMSRR